MSVVQRLRPLTGAERTRADATKQVLESSTDSFLATWTGDIASKQKAKLLTFKFTDAARIYCAASGGRMD